MACAETTAPLLELDPHQFAANFDRNAYLAPHRLATHPLFALDRLVQLARDIPATQVEYNAGNLAISQDPNLTPRNGLSIEETVRRIEECKSWMVLKDVAVDPEYRALIDLCLDEVKVLSEPIDPGMTHRQGFIFVSSPGAVTSCHVDPEHNYLLQIRGTKQFSVFDRGDRELLSEEQLEAFHDGGHRNIPIEDRLLDRARVFELKPGDALHVPITHPHWVKVNDEVSVSFSICFRTRASRRRADAYRANARLRRMGVTPVPVGRSRSRDSLKTFAYRAIRSAKSLVRGRMPTAVD